MLRFLIVGAITSFLTGVVDADDEVKLPASGSWVRYHFVTKSDNGQEAIFKQTLKFLGSQDHGGVACRWIEIDEKYAAGELQHHQLLVPERALRESSNPLSETLIYNLRDGEGEIQSHRLEMAQIFGASLLFLPAARKTAKSIDEPKQVDYQQGKLKIAKAHQGEFRWSREAITVKQTQTFVWKYSVWVDPVVPVGVAHGRHEFHVELDGVKSRGAANEVHLEDFGTGATSSFQK